MNRNNNTVHVISLSFSDTKIVVTPKCKILPRYIAASNLDTVLLFVRLSDYERFIRVAKQTV